MSFMNDPYIYHTRLFNTESASSKLNLRKLIVMFEVVFKQIEDFSNFVLVLPAVSVGNVGQLAVDLLINSLKTTKIGYINTPYIHALVGNDAFASGADPRKGKLTTACEIFRYDDHPILFVQINTPVVKGKSAEFRSRLRQWIKERKFQKVVMLTSSYAHQRIDAQIADTTCRFLCTPAVSSLEEKLIQDLHWKVLEEDHEIPAFCGQALEEGRRVIPGGGITSAFYQECSKEEIPLIVLLQFCFEGNNIPDAFALVAYLNQWLSLAPNDPTMNQLNTWKCPKSWKLFFGNAPPSTIY